MKEELRKKLSPYLTQLEEISNDRRRIDNARTNCIARNKLNGCWNCPENNDACVINQTTQMVESRIRLAHLNITHKVIEWLGSA